MNAVTSRKMSSHHTLRPGKELPQGLKIGCAVIALVAVVGIVYESKSSCGEQLANLPKSLRGDEAGSREGGLVEEFDSGALRWQWGVPP